MTTIAAVDHPRYKWRFTRDTVYALAGFPHALTATLRGRDGRSYAQIFQNHLTIFEGYHFDGCTLAPDFADAVPGCAVHDALLQILDQHPGLFDEQLAHDNLRHVHRAYHFNLAGLYHWAVSGWPRKLYKRFTKGQA